MPFLTKWCYDMITRLLSLQFAREHALALEYAAINAGPIVLAAFNGTEHAGAICFSYLSHDR